MGSKRRALTIFILSVIGSAALLILDISEQGFTVGDIAGPVLIMGLAGIPGILEYIKLSKNGKT